MTSDLPPQLTMIVRLLTLIVLLLSCDRLNAQTEDELLPLEKSGPTHPIEEFNGYLFPHEFLEKYLKYERPVVMRGAAKDSPAFERWTDDYLRSITPNNGLKMLVLEKRFYYSAKGGYKEFHHFLNHYKSDELRTYGDIPSVLASDIILPFPLQCEDFYRGRGRAMFDMTCKGGSFHLSMAGYDNLMCVYRGRLHIVLANATENEDKLEAIFDKYPELVVSTVNVQKADLKKFPAFKGMNFYVTDVEAGDCIYIPGYWMHSYVAPEDSISVDMWFSTNKIGQELKEKWDDTKCDTTLKWNSSYTLDKFAAGKPKPVNNTNTTSPPQPQSKTSKIVTNVRAINKVVEKIAYKVISVLLQEKARRKELTPDLAEVIHRLIVALDVNKNNKFDVEDFNVRLDGFVAADPKRPSLEPGNNSTSVGTKDDSESKSTKPSKARDAQKRHEEL